jgi:uroporphyrin-III C-methyltransferase/precorrin-2 dehydrogenase/sirohydrochlorin ferrochelatase
MRDVARAVLIATGHTTDHSAADLSAYRPDQTLALYMAIANFGAIAERLIGLGHRGDLPIAVIENGTTDKQRVIQSTLEKLPTMAAEHNIQSPALLLIGQTVRYAQRYGWFNPRTVEADADNGFAKVI